MLFPGYFRHGHFGHLIRSENCPPFPWQSFSSLPPSAHSVAVYLLGISLWYAEFRQHSKNGWHNGASRPMSGQSTLVPCGIAWNVWGTICIKQTGSKDRVDSSGRQCKKGKKIEAVWVVEYSKNGTREQMEMSPFPPCVIFFFFFNARSPLPSSHGFLSFYSSPHLSSLLVFLFSLLFSLSWLHPPRLTFQRSFSHSHSASIYRQQQTIPDFSPAIRDQQLFFSFFFLSGTKVSQFHNLTTHHNHPNVHTQPARRAKTKGS